MARTPSAREPLSFAQQLDRLEEIVWRLEGQELDLDEALKLFEEGIERLREARARLTAAEAQVKQVPSELAAAVEVVHAYSLVHDDLPCMDNDDLRRGRPTTHRAFDVGTATVAGFHMVALSARVLDAGMAALDLEPARRRTIALELFRAAGAGGMIGGQALDLEAEGRRLPAAQLEDGHRRQTGALIAAPGGVRGRRARGPGGACESLPGYGADVRLAFQIQHDPLDATATSDPRRKTARKDA